MLRSLPARACNNVSPEDFSHYVVCETSALRCVVQTFRLFSVSGFGEQSNIHLPSPRRILPVKFRN